jgi:hypothetical protein
MVTRHLIALALGATLAQPALAAAGPVDQRPKGVNARQQHQQARIRHGVRADEISRGELARLRADEARLRAEEHRYRDSGRGLNTREYRDLQRDLDRVSRQIARATHNDR